MILPYPEAQTLTRYYVCSDCWEHLQMFSAPKDAPHQSRDVHCSTDGCQCSGFISIRWVEHEESEQKARLAEAKKNLAGVLDWMPRQEYRKSTTKILEELGL